MSFRVQLPVRRRRAFSIVELLAAMAVFIGLMLMLVTATNQTGDLWRRSSSKIEQFQQARRGYESMTRRISQATLNTYWDYHYKEVGGKPDKTQPPDGYMRQSELRIRSGLSSRLLGAIDDGIFRPTHSIFFQAPLGFVDDDLVDNVSASTSHKPLNNLLNTWGFFVEVNDDLDQIPDFLVSTIKPRTRSRLMEMMEPSESFKMDNPSQVTDAQGNITTADPNWDNAAYLDWFVAPIKKRTPVRVLAENVLALVILPRLTPQDEASRKLAGKDLPLCPVYDYDSKRLSNQEEALNNPKRQAIGADGKVDPELNPKNQLPPVITVAMVAIDETSARRLAETKVGQPGFGLKLEQFFQKSPLLEDDPETPAPKDGDLSQVEALLVKNKLTYRIFTSNVAIRGAKWSRWQEINLRKL